MPRSSGIYTPPGSAFPAVSGTLIESAKFNSIINDISTALTQSIATTGTSTVSASIPMNNNKLTGLAIGSSANDSVRVSQLSRGTDINITASGVQAVPSDGSHFAMTAAASFSITGFSSTTFTGRTFSIKFPTNFSQTLTNSATFKLRDGQSRRTILGETCFFILQSISPSIVFEEVAKQSILDLTGYAGADIPLGVGQSANYDFTAVTSINARLLTAANQIYEFEILPTIGAGLATGTNSLLSPNNTAFAGAFNSVLHYQENTAPTAAQVVAGNTPLLDAGFRVEHINGRISTKTTCKTVSTHFANASLTNTYQGVSKTLWNDTTTVWSSFGAFTFANAITGSLIIRRIF